MKPKLTKFLQRAAIELPGKIVILITSDTVTGETELISNLQTREEMHEIILNIAYEIPKPKKSTIQKLIEYFKLKK